LAQFEIAGVQQASLPGLDKRHGTTKNMSGRQERQFERRVIVFEATSFTKVQHVFMPNAWQATIHQLGRWRAQDNFAMRSDVIGMGMADEDSFQPELWLVRIQPEAKLGQMQGAGMKLDSERRHDET